MLQKLLDSMVQGLRNKLILNFLKKKKVRIFGEHEFGAILISLFAYAKTLGENERIKRKNGPDIRRTRVWGRFKYPDQKYDLVKFLLDADSNYIGYCLSDCLVFTQTYYILVEFKNIFEFEFQEKIIFSCYSKRFLDVLILKE